MKRINRKGFTLMELLVVLVLLVVIMAIAIPSITSTVERNKTKDKQLKQELAVSAGEIYIEEHASATNGVLVSTLISSGDLPGIKTDSEVCENGTGCCVKKVGNTYSLNNSTSCTGAE